ncbi:hypothetical protein CRG98_045336 [Punica granatum]|uniref:Uncharacterized protein n=1 Tax=Punica granatum TaxID=22663 RepID=A0A2I0HRE9_PUNGR|nr:hypothetical protein CRG98_045336 [Punica granatum]
MLASFYPKDGWVLAVRESMVPFKRSVHYMLCHQVGHLMKRAEDQVEFPVLAVSNAMLRTRFYFLADREIEARKIKIGSSCLRVIEKLRGKRTHPRIVKAFGGLQAELRGARASSRRVIHEVSSPDLGLDAKFGHGLRRCRR